MAGAPGGVAVDDDVDADGASVWSRPTVAAALASGGLAPQLAALGIAEPVAAAAARVGSDPAGEWLPDAWLNRLAGVGDPQGCAAAIDRLATAGADAIVLVPPPARSDDQIGTIHRDLPLLLA